MSKNNKLVENDVSGYKINPSVLELIETYCNENNIAKQEIRILDYGSGRGRSVAVLRNMGFLAFGVEVDLVPFNNGLDYFEQNGYKPNDFLSLIGNNCKTTFGDNFFDIVFSEQVLEHVEEVDIMIEEISRITKDGGVHIHTFPAKYHLVEQHLFMPIIHWLPKNRIRKWAIFLFTKLGKEPYWDTLSGRSTNEKTEVYYSYSTKKTFYRSAKRIKRLLDRYGFVSSHEYFYNGRGGIKGKIHGFFPSQIQISSKKLSPTTN